MADLDGGYLVSQRHYKGFGTCVHTKRSVGIASVNTLAAYQSLKLDCTGFWLSRSAYSKFVIMIKILCYLYYHVTFMYCSNCFPDTLKIKTKNPQGLKLQYLVLLFCCCSLTITFCIQKCTTAGGVQVTLKLVEK